MQERGMITNMDLRVYLENLKKNPRFTDEMLQLVEEDLKFGLSTKETEEYTGKKLDYMQMKVYSKCLRSGYGRQAMEVIAKEELTGEQMAVALEFYEKGVPLGTVREITENTGQTAFAMQKRFQDAIKKLEEVRQNTDRGEGGINELFNQFKEAVDRIKFQEEQYRTLNENLKELYTAGQDAKVQDNLVSQIADKDMMLEKQQDQLNSTRAEIVKLRHELETAEREKQVLEKKIEEIEKQEAKKEQKETVPEMREKEMPAAQKEASSFSAEYRVVLHDEKEGIVHIVPVEGMEKKRNKKNLSPVFSRIRLKRKIDVVRLVAEKGLEPEQLVQVRNAIERQLTDRQLMVLIEHGLPAEQMKEIIDIAVYENGQKDGNVCC